MASDTDAGETLSAAYARCRALHRAHGRSYYLASRLLPAWKRRHVSALYGFTRTTDDIVDVAGRDGVAERARRLDSWQARVEAALDRGDGGDDPVLPALVYTVATFGVARADVDAFLASMRMDLTVDRYGEYADLLGYMEGSAAVIGTMMLPILLAPDAGGAVPAGTLRAAREPARQLGIAFQLTNFIRDVAEDLHLGRVYLPAADLARFGVTRTDLAARTASPGVRRLIAFEVDRARGHYRAARPGIGLLPPRSRRCIRLATVVYGGILDRVEDSGHDVLAGRAVVPRRRRAAAVVRELARAA